MISKDDMDAFKDDVDVVTSSGFFESVGRFAGLAGAILAPVELSRRERIREKIMSRVEIVDTGYDTPCHLWTGPTSGAGRGGDYPRMNLDGATVAVHKVSWVNEHGFIPPRKQLDHLCSQRRCVREGHLELTTHKQNQKRRDKRRKSQ